MANESKIVQACVKKLESMNQVSVDGRPKTLLKLKNTLEKERKVIYVNDCIKHLLTLNCQKCSNGKQTVKIYKTDKELDREIYVRVKELADRRSLPLFVLPCDSPLHKEMMDQIKNWHDRREITQVDMADPSSDLVEVCWIESNINPDMVLNGLKNIGLMRIVEEAVVFAFPDQTATESLKKAFNAWTGQLSQYGSLSHMSVASYKSFAALIEVANAQIQKAKVEELTNYCIKSLSSWHTWLPGNDDVMETENTVNDDVSEAEMLCDWNETNNLRNKTINQPLFVWPLSLDPEIAYIILLLCDLENKPTTVDSFKDFVRMHGNIMYIVSPTLALPSDHHGDHKSTKYKKLLDTKSNADIFLGTTVIENMENMDIVSWLATVLTVPGPSKRSKADKMEILSQKFDMMDTSSDNAHIKEKMCSFQRYVLNTAKHLAQKTGCVLLYGDADADKRCRDAMEKYLALDLNRGDDKELFSKTIAKLGCEFGSLSVDYLISLLVQNGYLEINETDGTVNYGRYTSLYQYKTDDRQTEEMYVHDWEPFYRNLVEQRKAMEEPGTSSGYNGKKRRCSSEFDDTKRQKMLGI